MWVRHHEPPPTNVTCLTSIIWRLASLHVCLTLVLLWMKMEFGKRGGQWKSEWILVFPMWSRVIFLFFCSSLYDHDGWRGCEEASLKVRDQGNRSSIVNKKGDRLARHCLGYPQFMDLAKSGRGSEPKLPEVSSLLGTVHFPVFLLLEAGKRPGRGLGLGHGLA